MRLSSNTSTPRSLRLRISRPNPCFSAIAACGTWYSKNAFPPASFKCPDAGLDNWVARHREWQFINDNAAQLVALYIHALPER